MAGHRRGHPTNTHTHPPATSLAMTRPSATAAKQRTVTISDTGAPNTSLPLPSDSHETGLHLVRSQSIIETLSGGTEEFNP